MSAYNQLNAYKETSINTAGQGRLIIMLYRGAIEQINKAISLFPYGHQRYDEINASITKAQDIVTELMASLDFERGGDIAKQLFSLYFFFNDQLMQANMNKNVEMLKLIKGMLEDLETAWSQISNTQADPKQMGINISL